MCRKPSSASLSAAAFAVLLSVRAGHAAPAPELPPDPPA